MVNFYKDLNGNETIIEDFLSNDMRIKLDFNAKQKQKGILLTLSKGGGANAEFQEVKIMTSTELEDLIEILGKAQRRVNF